MRWQVLDAGAWTLGVRRQISAVRSCGGPDFSPFMLSLSKHEPFDKLRVRPFVPFVLSPVNPFVLSPVNPFVLSPVNPFVLSPVNPFVLSLSKDAHLWPASTPRPNLPASWLPSFSGSNL